MLQVSEKRKVMTYRNLVIGLVIGLGTALAGCAGSSQVPVEPAAPATKFQEGFVEGLEGTIIQRRLDALEKMAQLCGPDNYQITNMDETNEGTINVGGPEPVGDGMVLVSESVIKFRWHFVCNN